MSPEERSVLMKTHELVEENNKILRKMRRGQLWANVTRVIYWLVILGLSAAAYHFIQPYLNQLIGFYENIRGSADALKMFAR